MSKSRRCRIAGRAGVAAGVLLSGLLTGCYEVPRHDFVPEYDAPQPMPADAGQFQQPAPVSSRGAAPGPREFPAVAQPAMHTPPGADDILPPAAPAEAAVFEPALTPGNAIPPVRPTPAPLAEEDPPVATSLDEFYPVDSGTDVPLPTAPPIPPVDDPSASKYQPPGDEFRAPPVAVSGAGDTPAKAAEPPALPPFSVEPPPIPK